MPKHSSRSLVLLAVLALATAACSDEPTEPEAPGTDDAPAAQQTAISPVGQGQVVADQYIVTLEADADPGPAAAELADRFGGEILHVYRYALNGFAVRLPDDQAATALAESPRVVRVEPDQVVEAIDQTLPAGIDRIEADANSTANIDNTDDALDVDIAIIDTGIDLDHADLEVNDAVNCIQSGATADDDNGHGTHVAGSAAAIDNTSHVVGAAPGARTHAVKVLDESGSGTISSVVCGIDHVTNNAGTIEVANMSLGAQGTSESMRTAIQNSVAAGVYYAVAAGNDAEDVYGPDQTFGTDDDFIPAAYPEAATVSAMADYDGTSGGGGGSLIFTGCGKIADDTFAECFSNFSTNVTSGNPVSSPGAAIDLAAPGVSVLSTTNDGGTGSKSGTSMSSPHVAGSAAIEIVANGRDRDGDGDFDNADVKNIRQTLIDGGQDQSAWQSGDTNDPDSNPERLVFLGETTTTDSPPSVSWNNPTDGETVSGSVTIQIAASDSEDDDTSLSVEWRVDDGTWTTATYNSDTGYYEDTWDTTGETEGDHALDARATDSAGNTSSSSITVTVDNEADTSGGGMYVQDIGFRTTGPHLRSTVTIQQDSDGDGVAEASDDPVADATVDFTLRHDTDGDGTFDCSTDDCRSFTGTTDSSGQVEFRWQHAPSGDYEAEVTGLTHSSLTWDSSLDADNPDYFTF